MPHSSRHAPKASGQGGEQRGAGINSLFQISTTAAACDLIFFSSYLNQMFFSPAEASRHKVPAVKVNRHKALFFPPHPPAPASSTFPLTPFHPHSFLFFTRKQELCSNKSLIRAAPDASRLINTRTNETPVCDFHLGFCWPAYRGVLLVVPACDEAVLSLHLLHPLFIDLSKKHHKKNTHTHTHPFKAQVKQAPLENL